MEALLIAQEYKRHVDSRVRRKAITSLEEIKEALEKRNDGLLRKLKANESTYTEKSMVSKAEKASGGKLSKEYPKVRLVVVSYIFLTI